MSTKVFLKTENLVKAYGGRRVVDHVSISVHPGEIVGLLGPNGAGKTTTFYSIVGLIKQDSGMVYFKGSDITGLPMYKRARLGMGFLPQESSVFRTLTVEDNLRAIIETLNLPAKEQTERLNVLLNELTLTHLRKNKANTLSGGETRRLEIARSLITSPSLLMMDEPFSGVDPISVTEVQNIIMRLKDLGIAILITDHNARETLSITDRSYLIYEGRVLKSGSSHFLAHDEEARKIYLGTKFNLN